MAWRFIYFVSVDGKVEDMRLHKQMSLQDLNNALQVTVSSTSEKYSEHLTGKHHHHNNTKDSVKRYVTVVS